MTNVAVETKEYLDLLVETAPDWCSISTSEFGTIIKLDQSIPLKLVLAKITARLESIA
jgi:hypothetical protein